MTCALAGEADHAELATFLGAPMGTRWSLGYRLVSGLEPACAALGERWHAAIVRDAGGRIVGCGFRFVRRVRFERESKLLGYLGWLRRDPALGTGVALKIGACMALLRAQRREDELPWDLTAIGDDNQRARRLLERGLPGLPRYHAAGVFRSALFCARRRAGGSVVGVEERPGDDAESRALVARDWAGLRLAPAAVQADRFLVLREGGRVCACLGLRDERARRRLVLAAMPPAVRRWRPLINLGRHFQGLPAIPAAGDELDCLHLVACALPAREHAARLLAAAARHALAAGCDSLLGGASLGSPTDAVLAASGPAQRELARWYTVGSRPPSAIQPAHQEVPSL